jgi:rhomboid protease GluP
MAFGFPASYSELIPLNHLSQLQFIEIASIISKKTNWKLLSINKDNLTAITQNQKNTWDETILISFEEDVARIESSSNGNQFYDRGRNKKNVDAFLEFLYDVLNDTTNLFLDENSILENINTEQEKLSTKGQGEPKKVIQFYSFFSVFIPTKDYFITPILLYLNILYFLIMCFSGVPFLGPETQDIIDWGGNYGPLTTENEWWRLLSACFVHIGLLHLIVNCFALAYAGLLLESYLKKWGLLITYIFCGIIASLSSLYWNKDIVSAGASGAIFGLFGILLIAVLLNLLDKKPTIKLAISIVLLIIINIGYSFTDKIDTAAHLSGFGIGLLFGLILYFLKKKRTIALLLISSTASILIVFLFIQFRTSQVYIYQIVEYESKIQEFVDMEKMALEVYNFEYGHSIYATKEDALYMIKDRGIYYWGECITLLKELDKLYLPKEIHQKNEDLIEYCNLRISQYELAYKKINESTNDYDKEIGKLNIEIINIVKKVESDNGKI